VIIAREPAHTVNEGRAREVVALAIVLMAKTNMRAGVFAGGVRPWKRNLF